MADPLAGNAEVVRGIQGQTPIASRFLLEIDGQQIGVFSEVSGLSFEVGVHTHAEGGQNQYEHKLPKGITWPNLVFKRGIIDSNALFDWVAKSSGEQFAAGGNKLSRCSGVVVLLGTDDTTWLRAWSFVDAFPVRWTGPDLNINNSDPLTEQIEVAHHGFATTTQAQKFLKAT
jgi:phage tail-like protein